MARLEPLLCIRRISERGHFSEKELDGIGPFAGR
jgi:hypothetical protein